MNLDEGDNDLANAKPETAAPAKSIGGKAENDGSGDAQ
jgi:hypothetical protein